MFFCKARRMLYGCDWISVWLVAIWRLISWSGLNPQCLETILLPGGQLDFCHVRKFGQMCQKPEWACCKITGMVYTIPRMVTIYNTLWLKLYYTQISWSWTDCCDIKCHWRTDNAAICSSILLINTKSVPTATLSVFASSQVPTSVMHFQ